MKKRFPAFFLALALCLGLTVPAFAANADASPELYVSMEAENYPFLDKDLEIQLRGVDQTGKLTEPIDYSGSADFVVPTSEDFQVGVENLAENEQAAIVIYAFSDPDGDGVYNQRLFREQTEKMKLDGGVFDVTVGYDVLPLPANGAYEIADDIVVCARAITLLDFVEQAEGDYAFSAAQLHELFGDNTILNFYLFEDGEEQDIRGQVLLSAGAFDDVPGAGWYSAPVTWAVEKGITSGVSETEFAPGNDCTHLQILTFLSRAAGNTNAAEYDWAAEQRLVLEWATEKGMIGEGFDSGKSCTRAEAVNYIWQAQGKPDAKASSFSDMKGYEDYSKAVDWAYEKEITKGSGDRFDPSGVCNRAYIATFLYRAYN